MDWEPAPGVRGVVGGAGRGGVPLISQFIGSDSVITHVNTAGDPGHVVTLVGLMVMKDEPAYHR